MALCLYQVLGVNRDATSDEIKAAYKKRALESHPDKLFSARARAKGNNVSEFTQVRQAFEVLSDTFKRRIYDDTCDTCDAYDTYTNDDAFPNNVSMSKSNWTNLISNINVVFLNMLYMAVYPPHIIVKLQVPFHEVYNQKYKKVHVRVKRWNNGVYAYAIQVIVVSLISFQNEYVFVGTGDDSSIAGMTRGNIIIKIEIIGVSKCLTFDNLFSEHDLFFKYEMSLYDFYTCKKLHIRLGEDIEFFVENKQQFSYIERSMGIPVHGLYKSKERSDVYINIILVLPKLLLQPKPLTRDEDVLFRKMFSCKIGSPETTSCTNANIRNI